MNLNGKAAIVTGGTNGIGRPNAESLARAGANVCISARNAEELEQAVAELGDVAEGVVTGVACDVRSEEEVRAMFEHAVAELGGVDILVNNAGVGLFKNVEETT